MANEQQQQASPKPGPKDEAVTTPPSNAGESKDNESTKGTVVEFLLPAANGSVLLDFDLDTRLLTLKRVNLLSDDAANQPNFPEHSGSQTTDRKRPEVAQIQVVQMRAPATTKASKSLLSRAYSSLPSVRKILTVGAIAAVGAYATGNSGYVPGNRYIDSMCSSAAPHVFTAYNSLPSFSGSDMSSSVNKGLTDLADTTKQAVDEIKPDPSISVQTVSDAATRSAPASWWRSSRKDGPDTIKVWAESQVGE